MTDLSGRVDSLELKNTYFTQDLLRKIDTTTLSEYSIVWNNQLSVIETSLLTIQASLATLQSLYTNLNITVQNNYTLFTGHTGNTGIHTY